MKSSLSGRLLGGLFVLLLLFFGVTVFALDADRAADVEASVRDAIARA